MSSRVSTALDASATRNPDPQDLRALVREFERQLILHALEQHAGHQRRAAATLGLRPTTLHEKMKRLGICWSPRPPASWS